jgi:hypothetical protein
MCINTMTVLRIDLGFNDWIPLFEDRGPWEIFVKTVVTLGSVKGRHSFNFCSNIGFCRKILSHNYFLSEVIEFMTGHLIKIHSELLQSVNISN